MRSGLINRPVASGFIAAVVATVCSSISPAHPSAAGSVSVRAITYVGAVFGAAALATYLSLLVESKERRTPSRELALRISTTFLWLPPLLLFYRQDSWFAPVLFTAFGIEFSRLIAFLRTVFDEPALKPAEAEIQVHPFSVLKQDFPYGFHIPSRLVMGSFDELTVSYFLKGGRSDRSARIAIERFRLIPRGA